MTTRVDEIAVMEGRVLVRYPLTNEMLQPDEGPPPPGDGAEVGKVAELELDWVPEDEWDGSPFAASDVWSAIRHTAMPGWVQVIRLRV